MRPPAFSVEIVEETHQNNNEAAANNQTLANANKTVTAETVRITAARLKVLQEPAPRGNGPSKQTARAKRSEEDRRARTRTVTRIPTTARAMTTVELPPREAAAGAWSLRCAPAAAAAGTFDFDGGGGGVKTRTSMAAWAVPGRYPDNSPPRRQTNPLPWQRIGWHRRLRFSLAQPPRWFGDHDRPSRPQPPGSRHPHPPPLRPRRLPGRRPPACARAHQAQAGLPTCEGYASLDWHFWPPTEEPFVKIAIVRWIWCAAVLSVG